MFSAEQVVRPFLLRREPKRRELAFVHVGKCGGGSVYELLKTSSFINKKYQSLIRYHVTQPVYRPSLDYLFVVRNPIQRAVSAFNWRYRQVVEENSQWDRIPGEREALLEYDTFNDLAEALYEDDVANPAVADLWNKIFHLRQGFSYYLDPLLPNLVANQIFGVIALENLQADCESVLQSSLLFHIHGNKGSNKSTDLTEKARINLEKHLSGDFASLGSLLDLYPISSHKEVMAVRGGIQ